MIQTSSLIYYRSLIKFPGSGRIFSASEGNFVSGGEDWVGLMVNGRSGEPKGPGKVRRGDVSALLSAHKSAAMAGDRMHGGWNERTNE